MPAYSPWRLSIYRMHIFTDSPSAVRAKRLTRDCWLFTVSLLACLFALPLQAETDGRFEVVRASSRLAESDWLVDALLDLSLGSEAEQALKSGVTLTIQLQFQLVRERAFWPDELVLERQQTIELSYLLLSRRYVVAYPETNTQNSYATLYSALRQISLLRDYPLIAADQVGADDQYQAGLRVVLVQEVLPGPLQMLAFWRGDFSLESEWYRWSLKE